MKWNERRSSNNNSYKLNSSAAPTLCYLIHECLRSFGIAFRCMYAGHCHTNSPLFHFLHIRMYLFVVVTCFLSTTYFIPFISLCRTASNMEIACSFLNLILSGIHFFLLTLHVATALCGSYFFRIILLVLIFNGFFCRYQLLSRTVPKTNEWARA